MPRALIVAVLLAGGAAPTPEAILAELGDLPALRQQFHERLDAERRAARLGPLIADPALDRAAEEHAEALLAALLAGEPPHTVAALAERVAAARRGTASGGMRRDGVGLLRPREPGRDAGATHVGSSVVVDALTVEQALEVAFTEGSALRDPGYLRLGLGVAHRREGDALRTVWVVALSRR